MATSINRPAPLLLMPLTTAIGIMTTIDEIMIFHCISAYRDSRRALSHLQIACRLNTAHMSKNLIYVGNDVAVS